MSDTTKVTLSTAELAMAADKNIILTKRTIMEAAAALFNSLIPSIGSCYQDSFAGFEAIKSSVPKIAKGENYNGFPYVMMDYPAVFEKDNIFAIRTMFWWGGFISLTLHVSGKYKTAWEKNILQHEAPLADFFVCIGEDEWQHHFDESNYQSYTSLTAAQLAGLIQKRFMKVALRFELQQWNTMHTMLPAGYQKIKKLLLP